MVPQKELTCWEITQCKRIDDCPASKHPEKQCWDLASQFNDYRSSLKVCEDCLVYVAKQQDSSLSDEEIREILVKKGVCGLISDKCPLYKSETTGEGEE